MLKSQIGQLVDRVKRSSRLSQQKLVGRTISFSAITGLIMVLADSAGTVGQHAMQLMFLGAAVPTVLYAHAEERDATRQILRQVRRELRRGHGRRRRKCSPRANRKSRD